MTSDTVVSLTKRRLKDNPIIYSIVFRHGDDGMSFVVHDVADTEKDRLAVARDLEAAAECLKSDN